MTAEEEEAALLGLPPVAPERTRRYGPHPSQVIDYYGDGGQGVPPRGRGRVTVLHGGFWREAYDRTHLGTTAARLARQGFAVALAEYRRVGGGGGWPGTFDDVSRVLEVAWDGADHVLLGHSAGGHLALWAAHTEPGCVSRVVAVSPVADLAYAHRLGLSGGAVAELLGAEGELSALDPAQLPPAAFPAVILHGTADTDVPLEVSRRYAAVSGCELRELAATGHYGPLIPGSATWPRLLEALREER